MAASVFTENHPGIPTQDPTLLATERVRVPGRPGKEGPRPRGRIGWVVTGSLVAGLVASLFSLLRHPCRRVRLTSAARCLSNSRSAEPCWLEDDGAEHRPDQLDPVEVEVVSEPVHEHVAGQDHRHRQQQAPPEPESEDLHVGTRVLASASTMPPAVPRVQSS